MSDRPCFGRFIRGLPYVHVFKYWDRFHYRQALGNAITQSAIQRSAVAAILRYFWRPSARQGYSHPCHHHAD